MKEELSFPGTRKAGNDRKSWLKTKTLPLSLSMGSNNVFVPVNGHHVSVQGQGHNLPLERNIHWLIQDIFLETLLLRKGLMCPHQPTPDSLTETTLLTQNFPIILKSAKKNLRAKTRGLRARNIKQSAHAPPRPLNQGVLRAEY